MRFRALLTPHDINMIFLYSADKPKHFTPRVPFLIGFLIFKVFRLGAVHVTIVAFGLQSSLHGAFRVRR
jgi:hypothetical protein